jgi:hypothetical protein
VWSRSVNNLYAGFQQVAKTAVPYFEQWTYDHPLVVKPETNETMRFLQKAMYNAIRHFVENYDRYRHLMPVADEVAAVLSLCQGIPYRAGTYRTDFIIDENKKIWLIEITCRFALNGFFISKFIIDTADRFMRKNQHLRSLDLYALFLERLSDYFGAVRHVCILKGRDNRNETKHIVPVFEYAGYPVHLIEFDEIPARLDLLDNAAVIGELAHDELCALPRQVLERIIHANLLNDLRTVFLIHDKRFFSVLGNDDFLNSAMNRHDVDRFRAYLVPTFAWGERLDVWEQARLNKDEWIIKPRALGKGIGVHAGLVCDDALWQSLFLQENADDLTLQPFIQQAKFNGQVGKEIRPNDYVVGTLLFFEDEFFGPGFCRASSHPITNQGDDRKVAPLVIAPNHDFCPELLI